MILVLLSGGLLYFRLLQGPVSLTFLVNSVERGINSELKGLESSIEDIVMTLTESGALEFRLKNLKFAESDGDLVIAAPQAAMELSYFALWTLRATPSRVELIEPRLFMAYSEQSGLSLRFSPHSEAGLPGAASDIIVAPAPVLATRPQQESDGRAAPPAQTMDLAGLISRVSSHSSEGGGASSYLREVGFRNATVVLDTEGQTSTWQVPRLSVDLDHGSAQTLVSGEARISSRGQIWTLAFRADRGTSDKDVSLTASTEGLVPHWLGDALPQLAALRHFNLPVDADARVDLTGDGAVAAADITAALGRGSINLDAVSTAPFTIDTGRLNLKYDGAQQRMLLSSSTLNWGDSSLTLAGSATRATDGPGEGEWHFEVNAEQGLFGAGEFGIPPLPVDKWHARGVVAPERQLVKFDRIEVAAGGGQISMAGEFFTGGPAPGSRMEAEIGAMPITTLKVLWPRGVAEDARQWTGQKVSDGMLTGGTFRYFGGPYLEQVQPESAETYKMTLAMTLENVVTTPLEGLLPITLSRALVRLDNEKFEVVAPEGVMAVAADQPLTLKSARFAIADVHDPQATGEVVFAADGKVSTMLALIEMPAFEGIGRPEGMPETIAGNVDGSVAISFPLIKDLKAGDVKVKARARLTDGKAVDLLGDYDLKGATVDFDLSETAVDAKGEVLIDGVLAKLNWQRIFAAAEEQQPPIRITATLDEADRRQLGLDLGDALHGDVAIEVTVKPHTDRPSDVSVRADMTNADLAIEDIAWRKPTGRSAFMEFDIVYDPAGGRELKNFRLEGDDLSVQGTLQLGKKKQIIGFSFPKFWLNLVTRLDVRGKLNDKNVWEVRASGPTYDGRAFFRTLYSIPGARNQAERQRKQTGIDLTAEIENVLGHGDVNLRGMKLKLSDRAGELTALDAHGTLSGGKTLSVELRKNKRAGRQLLAKSADAGEVFKLVGFYPNMTDGTMRLEVNLDGKGPAQKTGILWVQHFQVLGDPVISEVAGSADAGAPSIDGGRQAKQRMVRQVFQFEQMRAPFSVGHGQFVLEDAYLRGPLQGATIRGRVDYGRQSLELGGTYIPLQGLNNAFGSIPVLGELLSGPRQEGIFGVTYAIQGSMEKPQVVVHPLSLIAPGIFREMFQMTPSAPRVQPRQGGSGNADPSAGVRSSSSPAGAGKGAAAVGAVDGWTSKASPATN